MVAKKFTVGNLVTVAVVFVCLAVLVGAAGAVKENAPGSAGEAAEKGPANTEQAGGSKVYFTRDISSQGILAVYRALGVSASGKVAVKLHMGEPGNQNYLRPELLRGLVDTVKGTFADSNTRYGGLRGSSASHRKAAEDHGFTYAPVDILDADGVAKVPIKNGKHLKEAIFGSHIMDYDWIISVAHFKGHGMAGFGGTFKNLAVGIAAPEGKGAIHGGRFSGAGLDFFERIIEYNQALMDAKPGRMIYINVLNNLSVDCDCAANAPKPSMPDIGVMASLDPVALEKASLDQIFARPPEERRALAERITSRNGIHQVTYGEQAGLGSQTYELIRL